MYIGLYFPHVISFGALQISASVHDQANREIDDNRGTESEDRRKYEYYPQQVGIHSAPVSEARADAHQLAIGFVEFKFVLHGSIAFFARWDGLRPATGNGV
ncbi:hypothetical protein SPHINGOR109_10224 [Sphingorhabdus sp. 109]|nr:hypothetical protein SPHINGOR109_10224 [Sphingorhabdus sp. 109]